jgi:hypothetical protein
VSRAPTMTSMSMVNDHTNKSEIFASTCEGFYSMTN